MRFENWDVILFQRDIHVPIQEFKTACYVACDEYGRQLPTLTCYIVSLPVGTPFRVSLHSWTAKTKPSAIIESRRKANQRVVYTVQVMVEGNRVYHDYYELSATWPQGIENEKRRPGPERQSSKKKNPLPFPPFRQNILMQSSWDARDNDGRIKVFLSEQLIGKDSTNPGDFETSDTHEIVCFSFQHAPQDVLEQAGISWPIRNPLYLPALTATQSFTPYDLGMHRTLHHEAQDSQMHPSYGMRSRTSISRPSNVEPFARPKAAPGPYHDGTSGPPMTERNQSRMGNSSASVNASVGDPFEDVNMMDTWSTQRSVSDMATDISMSDMMFTSPASSTVRPPWNTRTSTGRGTNTTAGDRQVVMTLRDDQFSALMEAVSPPKKRLSGGHNPHVHSQELGSRPPTPHILASRADCSGLPASTKPSAAALARTASYPHLRDSFNKASPARKDDKRGASDVSKPTSMYHPSGASGKENRVPTPFPIETHIPPPFQFMQGPGLHPPLLRYSVGGGSDVEMRDPSSNYSSMSRVSRTQAHAMGKNSPAPLPAENGSVMSRKEGLGINPPTHGLPDVRHDKSLLPALDTPAGEHKVPHNTPNRTSPNTRVENLLNANDDSKPFAPGHRSGMSSLDRIGQQLFSALGDTTSSFDDNAGSGTIDSGTLPELDFESPIMKRKRQGTMGGERGRSPDAKMIMREQVDLTGADQRKGNAR
ncbi:hypothetical protein BDV96DRAFT_297808 [Lophiotrema nucula]|uniref:Uncharacterized protein n=1 Tax=Lophiotrema nucula TaxID=690887 RepID=A0A6A5YLK2_9PLEO|nr:hypothetical protein BDV96DRAFT_297808 [Lophiotrema nucula]